MDIQEYPQLILAICTKEILKSDLIILSVIPVIMVGILGLYSLLLPFYLIKKKFFSLIIVTFIKCLFLIFVPCFCCEDSAVEYLIEGNVRV